MTQSIIKYKFDRESRIPVTEQLPNFLDRLIEEGHTIQAVIPSHYESQTIGCYFIYAATIITKI